MVEKLVKFGIEDILIVIGKNKNSIEDHFDHPLGLGHAISKAKSFIGDDIMYNPNDEVSKQLIDKYNEYGCSIVDVQEVAEKDVSKYGVIKPVKELDERIVEMCDFIEKPKLEDIPSLKACLGRYLLTADMFKYLDETKPGKGGEIQLIDAMLAMIKDNKKVLAYEFEGKRDDIGNKIEFLKANIEFGLKNKKNKKEIKISFKKIS